MLCLALPLSSSHLRRHDLPERVRIAAATAVQCLVPRRRTSAVRRSSSCGWGGERGRWVGEAE